MSEAETPCLVLEHASGPGTFDIFEFCAFAAMLVYGVAHGLHWAMGVPEE